MSKDIAFIYKKPRLIVYVGLVIVIIEVFLVLTTILLR